ncbi:MAG: hypothetical protein RBR53_09525 [Desulforegulaceae bacterium]|nr:hypothetical protein [Desulforegulaceae bacterium]
MSCLKNQKGSAMLIVLMMLVLITIIGFAAISDSFFNLKISSFRKKHSSEIYLCESLAIQGVSLIESEEKDRLRDCVVDWVYQNDSKVVGKLGLKDKKPKYFMDSYLKKFFSPSSNISIDYKNTDFSPKINGKIIAFYNGLSESGSQDIGSKDCVHDYTIVGRYEVFKDKKQLSIDSVKMMEIGVRRKF